MKISEEQIFVLTNPIFWIWALIIFVMHLIKKALDLTGIYDWYYVLFKFKRMSKSGKDQIVFLMDKRAIKLFWLKRKAWEYATSLIKKENTL
jgi:hypothetical protein